jgi:hypothetical protein
MPEGADWLWAVILLAEAGRQDQVALRLLGAIGAWGLLGHWWAQPFRSPIVKAAERGSGPSEFACLRLPLTIRPRCRFRCEIEQP